MFDPSTVIIANMSSSCPHPKLWTVGHSTRSSEEFVALLSAHEIHRLIDIRRYPGSRRYPHFNSDCLAESLSAVGLGYEHLPELGGRRRARPDSPNGGWKNTSFRGYADYMQTEEFRRGVEKVMACGSKERTVIMCAEAVPWRCHRSLIADALVTHGWEVVHIMGAGKVQTHRLTSFAVVQGDRLVYPAPADADTPPRLF
ncbi:MAG: DUF488 domain-containing protein [Nitrospira sp.]|jgi:uncharacterized protein (DUF488 family)|nr:MAG: DUF488 domain-containing protein [Nitrospira sp.]